MVDKEKFKRKARFAHVAPEGWRQLHLNPAGDIIIPDDFGLLLRMDRSGRVYVDSERDGHFPKIHPNCYAPDHFANLRLLKGGGSGTAVFEGDHIELGRVVMKHASHKDLVEVFSLAEIGRQLCHRSAVLTQNDDTSAKDASNFLHDRIPEFVFCFISPHHVRDRSVELWNTMRGTSVGEMMKSIRAESFGESDGDSMSHLTEDPASAVFQTLKEKRSKRQICVIRDNDPGVEVQIKRFVVHAPVVRQDCIIDDGFDFLAKFAKEFSAEQQHQSWKCTVAQTCIGGPRSRNGASVLNSGKLKGDMLEKTLEEFTRVMKCLGELTLPVERQGINAVRKEMADIAQHRDVTKVSQMVDEFVGTAIKKNFTPGAGRFCALREVGESLRSGTLVLTREETTAAACLGAILEQGSKWTHVIIESPSTHCALDHLENCWFEVLQLASSFDSPIVNDRIWTCGLTDAGLHNTFLCEHRGMELFDLGEPQLMPKPAFLTKFLMSLFHTFGMVDDEDTGSWVCRFQINDIDKEHSDNVAPLSLTKETKFLLPYIYDTFESTLDHLVNNIFEGDTRVRELLVTYTILQLLSDSSYAIERWVNKGGGRPRVLGDHNKRLEKWVWRCLWDLYIASDVYEKILVPMKENAC